MFINTPGPCLLSVFQQSVVQNWMFPIKKCLKQQFAAAYSHFQRIRFQSGTLCHL
jgi:hypothetical protein